MSNLTSTQAYRPMADATEAARGACDAWIAASKQYETTHSLADYEALKVAHRKWQNAVKAHTAAVETFQNWHLGRKYSRNTQ